MGGANNICSDKTGTLTKNQMTWTQIWFEKDFKIEETDDIESINLNNYVPSEFSWGILTQCICCNTIGGLKDAGATELAMLKFIDKCGIDFELIREKYLQKEMVRFLFDSARKRMSTIIELSDNEKTEFNY